MSEYPEDIVKTAANLARDIMGEYAEDGTRAVIADALMAERERNSQKRFEELQAAYRRGVDFACESAGVGDDDYTELWRYVPKAAYDYADKATGPVTSPPSSAAPSSEPHPSEQPTENN